MRRSARTTIPILKPMIGPLSGRGSGGAGIAVWTSPSWLVEEWTGIRVCIEAGRVERVIEDEEVWVGFDDDDGNDDESC